MFKKIPGVADSGTNRRIVAQDESSVEVNSRSPALEMLRDLMLGSASDALLSIAIQKKPT